MGLTLDFSADQAVLDNLEAVTFTSVRTAGNQTVSVADAAFYPEGRGEGSPSYGVYAKWRATFSIRIDALAAVGGPNLRDTIARANGDVYTVLDLAEGNITRIWQIGAVNLVLAANLVQTGTLQRPSNSQDAAGRAALTSYSTVASDIPCRVQPIGVEAADVLERRTIPQRFTAILGQQVSAQAKDQFVVGSALYTVLGAKNPERIDELQTLELELVL